MNSDPVKFSVVIPLYNKGPHIEATIRSVLAQDYPAAEILVVDDASTDDGRQIVQTFSEARLLSRHQPGPGGYAARNAGIEASSSEWIAFLDADDKWRPDHLSTLAAAISAHRGDVGCAFTRPVFVDGGVEKPYKVSEALEKIETPIDLNAFVAAWLSARTCPMWTGAVAIRRSDLLAAGRFPAGAASRGGDKDTWLRVMSRTKAIFVPKVTAEFHQDTVNRVTKSLDYSVQPIICKTIQHFLTSAKGQTRRLLTHLNNMEVVYYARYAAGARAPFSFESFRTLRRPALRSVAALLSYAAAGTALRILKTAKPGRALPARAAPQLAADSVVDSASRPLAADRTSAPDAVLIRGPAEPAVSRRHADEKLRDRILSDAA